MAISRRLAALAITLAALACGSQALAQTTGEGPKAKEIRLLISHPPGGGYDAYARLLARHLGQRLPGSPAIVPQNMPGAAGLVLANYMFTQAARDGSVIALAPGSIGTAALFKTPSAHYDARQFTWLGSLNSEVAVAVSWRTSPVRQASDLFSRELIVGGAGDNDQSVVFPNALNHILGVHFKIIPGYPGSGANALALERGEIMGIGGWNYSSIQASHPDWIRDHKLNFLLQFSLHRHPALPTVPTVLELSRNEDERTVLKLVFSQSEMGRAVFAPPGVPAEATQSLRAGFRAVLTDPDFLADAKRSHLEINGPMSGEAVASLVEELYAAPPALIEQAATAMTSAVERIK